MSIPTFIDIEVPDQVSVKSNGHDLFQVSFIFLSELIAERAVTSGEMLDICGVFCCH